MQTEVPAIEQGGIKEFQKRPDLFRALCWAASAATVAILAWIIFEIGRQALPSVQKFGLEFLTSSKWVPNREVFGVAPFLIGTAVSSVMR
jgi:phosphate transport system permease protein